MAEGDNKIARSLMDLQPTAVIELFLIYPDALNHPTVEIPIHAGSVYRDSIIWQGKSYIPVAVEAEGFEQNATSQLTRPKIRISNKDFLVTSLLQNYSDFSNARIIRKRTFLKYLDDANFDGNNPFGEADSSAEISKEEYVVGQKTQETKLLVEFELSSPLDLENFEVNNRRVLGKYCYWLYRGEGCNYEGIPIQREDGKRFTDSNGNYVIPNAGNFSSADPNFKWEPTNSYEKGDISYLENPKIIIHPVNKNGIPQPMRTWYVAVSDNSGQNPSTNPSSWQKDGCNKKLSACRLRFNKEGEIGFEQSTITTTEKRMHYSGIWLNGYQNTGSLLTIDSYLTGQLTGSFSVMMWLSPFASPEKSTYLTTDTNVTPSFGNVFQFRVSENNFEQMEVVYPLDDGSRITGTFGNASNGVYSLFLISLDREEKEITVERDGIVQYRRVLNSDQSFGDITSNALMAMHEPAGATPNAIVGPIAFWARSLEEYEKSFLVELDDNGGRHARKYSRMTGLAESITGNRLRAFWENQGVGGDSWVDKEDVHTGFFVLSGINGNNSTGVNTTYSYPVAQAAFINESTSWLPFGGYPGTDGFSYQA